MSQAVQKKRTPEQIICFLREAEVLIAQGGTVKEVCRSVGISDKSYYRWRAEYGGMRVNQAKRLKDLERENARLRRVIADLALDKQILREAASGNF